MIELIVAHLETTMSFKVIQGHVKSFKLKNVKGLPDLQMTVCELVILKRTSNDLSGPNDLENDLE